jgi:hypothetical protein
LPQAVGQVRLRNEISHARTNPNLLFLIWALLIYVFFSFSTRQEYYIVPVFPALALLIGCWLGKEEEASPGERIRRIGRISSAILFGVATLVLIAGALLAAEARRPPAGTDLATLLQERPGKYALSMGHFLDLTPHALGAFRAPLIGFVIAFFVGCGLSWFWRRRGRFMAANLALAGMMVAMLYCAHLGFIIFNPVLSSKQLAFELKQQYRPGDVFVINGNLEAGSSVPFYSGIQAHVVGPQSNMWYGSLFPDAPPVYETKDSLLKLWSSNTRMFLFSETEKVPSDLRNPIFKVAAGGGKVILSNQPNR